MAHRLTRLSLIVSILLVWLASFAGCAIPTGGEQQACELDLEEAGNVASTSEELSSLSCKMSADTGYKSGKAFKFQVVKVDGEAVEWKTANAYMRMAKAAAASGVQLHIVSGFRTMAEQKYLYGCYVNCNCNSCNLAAKPGYSNHQSGHALDLNTSAGGVYNWLEANGAAYGFSRTVPSEPWHWEWWGGGPGGGPCGNKAPTGYLDSADCDSIKGWTQDPDDPGKAIDVHLYFGGPAGSGSPAKGFIANVHRDDLCAAIGSCEHGFSVRPPLSLLDGDPHPVHAYGIDSEGGANPELGSSPGTLACKAPAPTGVRRHVVNPDSLAAWKLDLFWQKLPLDDAAIALLPEGVDLPAAPALVQADDGSPEVWLVDGTYRRHVPDPTALAAWGFAFADIQSKPAAEVNALTLGPDLRPAPVLVMDSTGKVELVDDPFDSGEGGSGGTQSGSGGGGSSASGGKTGSGGKSSGSAQKTSLVEDEGGCSVERTPVNGSRAPLWLMLAISFALARRRVQRS
jgi:uncharacterized membrane protein YgcG